MEKDQRYVRSEVFTAVTMKNAVFWDVVPCGYCVNRRFGGAYRLHHQDLNHLITLIPRSRISYTLKMEAIGSSEMSVNTIATRRHIPEDGILQTKVSSIGRVPLFYRIIKNDTKNAREIKFYC
jgi:hypothetical protein